MTELFRTFVVTDESTLEEAKTFCINRLRANAGMISAESEDKLRAVAAIVESVRCRGDAAVAEFTERFDGVSLSPEQFEISKKEVEDALDKADRNVVAALERAHENIRRFHSKNLRQSWEETYEDGSLMGQRITPIESVGVYVPGGKAFYPSSVLMNIVPAKVAKVSEIVMVSPPSYHGTIHPLVLAAAHIAGATRIFRVGGAQAIAALAYGTATIPRVCKITGPGNIYVTLAKRLVRGICDIDSEAGPSEVLVIADEKANPEYVAAELICQSEHDEDAFCSLITLSKKFAKEVAKAVMSQLESLPRASVVRTAMTQNGVIFIVRSMEDAIELANLIAPEHLSLQVEVPMKWFDRIQHAGAVLLGGSTPVAVGDYYAGPNHILPTGGQARFSSALSVEDFRKTTNFILYSRERLRKEKDDIAMLARAEGLEAHARSVEIRK